MELYSDPKLPPKRGGKCSGHSSTEATSFDVLVRKIICAMEEPKSPSLAELTNYLTKNGDLKDATDKSKDTLRQAIKYTIHKGLIAQENGVYKFVKGNNKLKNLIGYHANFKKPQKGITTCYFNHRNTFNRIKRN